jgi:hypothetical protein
VSVNAPTSVCEDCDQDVGLGDEHACREGGYACAIGAHRWIDITSLGDLKQHLRCCRVGCNTHAWLTLPEPCLQ